MNNGEERKKKKRKRPSSEDRKVDEDRQPKASQTNGNGSNADHTRLQITPTDGLTGPELHLCKALLEGKVREYVVLKELATELGSKAAELVNTSESRIQSFLESYKQGETSTSQTRALAESLERINHALEGFRVAQDLPKYPLTPAFLLVFAWSIFHDGVEWDSANKRKLMEMLDTIQSHGNQPFNEARPMVIRANQHLFVYTMLDTEAYEGMMTATEETLERYKRLTGYEEKPSFQLTTTAKEEEDSSDAEVANSLLAGKQSVPSSQYSQSRAGSSKDSKRGYESSASYQGNGERTSRPGLRRKQKQAAESTPRDGSKKGKSVHRAEDSQPVASTSAVTLEHSNDRQKKKRPRPSASASSASSIPYQQETTTSAPKEPSRRKSMSPRPSKRRLVAPPSPPEEVADASAAELTTVILETESENDEPQAKAAAKAKAKDATHKSAQLAASESQSQKTTSSHQTVRMEYEIPQNAHPLLDDRSEPRHSTSLVATNMHTTTVAEGPKPPHIAVAPILPHSPSPSVRPELSTSSEADSANLATSLGGAASPLPPTAPASQEQSSHSGRPNDNVPGQTAPLPPSAPSSSSVKHKPSARPLSPVGNIRTIEIFDSDEEEEAAAAALKEKEREQAKDKDKGKGKEKAVNIAKQEEPTEDQPEFEGDTGPNFAGIRIQPSANVSESEEEIDELEEDATFIQPQPSTTTPLPQAGPSIPQAISMIPPTKPDPKPVPKGPEPKLGTLPANAAVPSTIAPTPPVASAQTRPFTSASTNTTERTSSARPPLHPPSAAPRPTLVPTSLRRPDINNASSIRPSPDQTPANDPKGKGKARMDDSTSTSTTTLPFERHTLPLSTSTSQNNLQAKTAVQISIASSSQAPELSKPPSVNEIPKAVANAVQKPAATSGAARQDVRDIFTANSTAGSLPPTTTANSASTSHASTSRLPLGERNPGPAAPASKVLPQRVEPFEDMEDRWDAAFEEMEQHVWDALDRTGSDDADELEELRAEEAEYHAQQKDLKRACKAYSQMRNRRRRGRRSAAVQKLQQQQAEAARRNSLPNSSVTSLNIQPTPATAPSSTTGLPQTASISSALPTTSNATGSLPNVQSASSTTATRPSATASGQDQLKQAPGSQVPVARSHAAGGPNNLDNIHNRAQEMLQRLTQGNAAGQPLAQAIAERYRSDNLPADPPAKMSDVNMTAISAQDKQEPPVRPANSVDQPEPNRPAPSVPDKVQGSNTHQAPSAAQTTHEHVPQHQSSRSTIVDIRPRFPDFFASIRKPTLATELRVQRPAQFTLHPYHSGGQQVTAAPAPAVSNPVTNASTLPTNSSRSVPAASNLERPSNEDTSQQQPLERGINPRDTVLVPPAVNQRTARQPSAELRRSVPPSSQLGQRVGNLWQPGHATSATEPPITGPFAPRLSQQQPATLSGPTQSVGKDPPSANAASALQAPDMNVQQSHRRHVSLDHPMMRRMAQLNNPPGQISVPPLDMVGQPISASAAMSSPAVPQRAGTASPATVLPPVQEEPQQQVVRASSLGPSRTDVGANEFEVRQQVLPETDLSPTRTSITMQTGASIAQDVQSALPPVGQARQAPSPQTAQTQAQPAATAVPLPQLQPQLQESRMHPHHMPYFQQMQMIAQQHQRQGLALQSQASVLPNHLQRSVPGREMSPPNPAGPLRTGQPNTPLASDSLRQQSPQQHQNSPPFTQAPGQTQYANQQPQLAQSQRPLPQQQPHMSHQPAASTGRQQHHTQSGNPLQHKQWQPAHGRSTSAQQVQQLHQQQMLQQHQRQQSPPQHVSSRPAVPQQQQAASHQQAPPQQAASLQLSQSQQRHASPPRPASALQQQVQHLQQQQRQQSPPQQGSVQQVPRQAQNYMQQAAPVSQLGPPQLSQSQQGQARPPPAAPSSSLQPYPLPQQQQMQTIASRQVVQSQPIAPFNPADFGDFLHRQHLIEQYAIAHSERGNPGTIETAVNFFTSTGWSQQEINQFRSRAWYLIAVRHPQGPLPP